MSVWACLIRALLFILEALELEAIEADLKLGNNPMNCKVLAKKTVALFGIAAKSSGSSVLLVACPRLSEPLLKNSSSGLGTIQSSF